MATETVERRVEQIVEEFSSLDGWLERYRHLVEMGEEIPAIDDAEKTEENYIPGCQYDVWIRVEHEPERGIFRFQADSDARLTKGLAALVIRVLDGQPRRAVLEADFDFLETMGLRTHLSTHRENGLRAMIHHMKARARHHGNVGDGAPGGVSA